MQKVCQQLVTLHGYVPRIKKISVNQRKSMQIAMLFHFITKYSYRNLYKMVITKLNGTYWGCI